MSRPSVARGVELVAQTVRIPKEFPLARFQQSALVFSQLPQALIKAGFCVNNIGIKNRYSIYRSGSYYNLLIKMH
jgi:hypothetical protein